MTRPVPRDVLRKVCKLAQLPEEVRQSRFAVSITRLTILKSLCQAEQPASGFVIFLARKTLGLASEMATAARPIPKIPHGDQTAS